MTKPIDILLVTGFLGSGKTTLLNSLLAQLPQGRRVAVLMNEFGEIGIDGALLHGDDYDLIEISRGSIFCVCVKTDYIRALHRLAQELRPELLIIETTGVANPADMSRDLQLGIFKGKFVLLDQVCIIDPDSFPDVFDVYASVEKQVMSSKLFILNKTDIAPRGAIERSMHLIREYNPRASFIETSFCRVPIHSVWPAAKLPATVASFTTTAALALGTAEMDRIIDEIFSDRSREYAPPDTLISEVLLWGGGNGSDFSKAAQELPEGILRAKGFLKFGDDVRLYSRTMRHVRIEDVNVVVPDDLINKVVIIYPRGTAPAMDAYLSQQPLFKRLPGSLKENRLAPFAMIR